MTFDARAEAHALLEETDHQCPAHIGGDLHGPTCMEVTAALQRAFAAGRTEGRDEGLELALSEVQKAEDAYLTREHDTFSEGATEGCAFARNVIERVIERERTGGRGGRR